ncbi:MAG TPA: GNAT family N-acetyltransferase [Verrucomicrobiae bacterium]
MKIKVDDLSGWQIQDLLRFHISHLSAISDPCSMHALNLDALRKPNITFWSVWSDAGELMGCGALKELDAQHAEVKSMRTAPAHLRKGVASHLLDHIINEAKRRHYRRLSLETGASELFVAAHGLYSKFGFQRCGPFGDYKEDLNSFFFTREL